jgi:hypothetical protein
VRDGVLLAAHDDLRVWQRRRMRSTQHLSIQVTITLS